MMSKRYDAETSALEDVRVASPCSADWDAMKGDDRVRFCSSCAKNVYNLSGMPRGEAESLLRQREDDICIRVFRRTDGTVISDDCPVGVRKKRVRRLALAVGGTGAFAVVGASALVAVASVTMGARVRPEPPAPSSTNAAPTPDLEPPPVPVVVPSSSPAVPTADASQRSPERSGAHVVGRRRPRDYTK